MAAKRAPTDALGLHEELLLLALHDERGTVDWRAKGLRFALSGALLGELLLRGGIRLEDERKHFVEGLRAAPWGDDLLTETMVRIAASKRRQRLRVWVARLGGTRRLIERIALQLVERGALRVAEERVLWIFRRRIYPELDGRRERALRARIESAIKQTGPAPDERTVFLIALAHTAGLLTVAFGRPFVREHRQRIKSLGEGNVLAGAARAAQEAVAAAAG